MDDFPVEPEYNALLADDPVDPPQPTSVEEDHFEETTPDLNTLIRLGALADTVEYLGHNFSIRTPHTAEELAAELILGKYTGTPAYDRAEIAATVASFVTHVDGQALTASIGPNDVQGAVQRRFSWLITNLHFPVIAHLASECVKLRVRRDVALKELEGKS